MIFAKAILCMTAAGLAALLLLVRRFGGWRLALPALIWFVLSFALYAARIIDAWDARLDALLYNNLSNTLRVYSAIVLFAYAAFLVLLFGKRNGNE